METPLIVGLSLLKSKFGNIGILLLFGNEMVKFRLRLWENFSETHQHIYIIRSWQRCIIILNDYKKAAVCHRPLPYFNKRAESFFKIKNIFENYIAHNLIFEYNEFTV